MENNTRGKANHPTLMQDWVFAICLEIKRVDGKTIMAKFISPSSISAMM